MDIDIQIKCRGCLSEEPEMHNLFHLLSEDLTLASILSQTTSQLVEENVEISPFLCKECTETVVNFYNFKIRFKEVQLYFQNELSKVKYDHEYVLENSENVNGIKDNLVLEQPIKEDFWNGEISDDDKLGTNFKKPQLLVPIENKKNQTQNISNEINCLQKLSIPEIGEFTVQNELVQLIESVVYSCKMCRKKYLLKEEFLDHMISEHNRKEVDVRKFTTKTLVKLPLSRIIEENIDNDNDCEFKKDMPPQKGKVCKTCNTNVLLADYESHRDEHKNHFCGCGARFLRKNELVNHEMSKHSEDRRFICNYCNKAFKIKQLLTKHVRLHTHPRSQVCHICGQVFNDVSVLKTHIKLKHFPTRDYQCSQCGLKFPLKSTLDKHIRRHNKNRQRSYSCAVCNMTYYEKSTLNRHISVKHSNQPIKARCEYCGNTFTTKGNLYKHLRTTHKYDKVVVNTDENVIV